jgi:uncharacterized sulfatase
MFDLPPDSCEEGLLQPLRRGKNPAIAALRLVPRRQVVEEFGEILADLEYPPEVFDLPWLTHVYGSPDYVVRDLVREESGWWDRNPTSLHPAAPADVARATFDAIADPDAIIARTETLAADGKVQLAMHVIDLVALGPDNEPAAMRARTIKADLCRARSKEIDPYPSKGLYKSSARLLRAGTTSWEGVIQ